MISFTASWAIVIRLTRVWKKDPNLLLSQFYWPLLDILIWGFLGAWIAQSAPTELKNYELIALMGISLWQIVGRGCNLIGTALTEELWANNLVNLFCLPLRTIEWVVGVLIFYFIMMAVTSIFSIACIFMLYAIPFWQFVSTFLLFTPALFFSGIWIGFTCLSVIISMGKRGIEMGYVIAWFLLPFSGAYYPIEVLPAWAQFVSSLLPMTPLFEGMRGYLMHQQDPTPYLLKGYALGIPFALGAVLLFICCFNLSKRRGLARLGD